jgi:hypothetical protein
MTGTETCRTLATTLRVFAGVWHSPPAQTLRRQAPRDDSGAAASRHVGTLRLVHRSRPGPRAARSIIYSRVIGRQAELSQIPAFRQVPPRGRPRRGSDRRGCCIILRYLRTLRVWVGWGARHAVPLRGGRYPHPTPPLPGRASPVEREESRSLENRPGATRLAMTQSL